MRLSFFTKYEDNRPRHRELTWEQFAGELQTPLKATCKEDTPLFCPAEFAPNTTRAKLNVIRVHLGVLDIDCIDDAGLEDLVATLKPFEYVAYTTLSHYEKKAKGTSDYTLRIVLPLKSPVANADWESFWYAFDRMTGHVTDIKPKSSCHFYILPAKYPQDPPPLYEHHKGNWLDPAEVLAKHPPEKATTPLRAAQGLDTAARVDPSTLRRRANALARYKDDPRKTTLADNLRALASGKPYGEPGKRNSTMLSLTMELERLFPTASTEAIAEAFGASHDAMLATDDSPPDPISTVEYAIRGARDKRLARLALRDDEVAHDKAMRIQQARGDGECTPYTEAELHRMAAMHGVEHHALRRLWMLRHGTQIFFLTIGGYSRGFPSNGGSSPAWTYLAPVDGLQLCHTSGPNKFRSLDDLMRDYGTDIKSVCFDLRTQFSRYDPTEMRLGIASATRSHLSPQEHPLIHEWLTLLGGDKAERFLQRIACVPDMGKLICAIYLTGAPGVGKTLLATGLSRIWQRGVPTSFERAVGRFNLELAQCPLVLADEGFPAIPPKQIAIALRNLIGSEAMQIEQKFGGVYPLEGPCRLIMAANNASLLDFRSELTPDDVEALAVRIMQVEPDTCARDIFRRIGPEETRAWQSHKIAEHVLHLHQTMHVPHIPGNRFAVQGELDSMMRHVLAKAYYPSLALQVIVKHITDPKRHHQRSELIRWHKGHLLVNQHGLEATWDELLPRGPRPPVRMSDTLKSICTGKNSRAWRVQGTVRRYWEVNMAVLDTWCEENGYDAANIRDILEHQADDSPPEGLRVIEGGT